MFPEDTGSKLVLLPEPLINYVSYFSRFPKNDDPALQEWIDNITKAQPRWKISPERNDMICSLHFHASDVFDGVLKENIAPTIFPKKKRILYASK